MKPLNIPDDTRKRIIDSFLRGTQIKDISKNEEYSTQVITRVLTTELTKLRERSQVCLVPDLVAEIIKIKHNMIEAENLQEPQKQALNIPVVSTSPLFDYIKCPLHRYTFQVRNIREWTENNCEGRTLNLFAGRTKLNIDEVRNDLDPEALADYRMDAVEFLRTWRGEKFDTVLLDPPYAFRKSMEMYKGIKCSPFKQMKDEIKNVLKEGGKVITFGYHSNTMGANRGFKVEKIALFSHGGAIHDTIASVERHCL